MLEKKVSPKALGAFLSAVAVAIREAGGHKEGYLLRRLNMHLDSFAEDESPLSDDERAELNVIRAGFEAYRKNPLLTRQ